MDKRKKEQPRKSQQELGQVQFVLSFGIDGREELRACFVALVAPLPLPPPGFPPGDEDLVPPPKSEP